MPTDLGRDTNIGTPPGDTQKVDVVKAEAIDVALKNRVTTRLDLANLHSATSIEIQERILGEEVDPTG